ncbi:MAG: hypothetical protein DKT66_08805 [Candidatus Melainabacteria bacterium]|nr:MAG: hypothetical protein DKT66_08805 [Candidatus Melainabacteria bacterium]
MKHKAPIFSLLCILHFCASPVLADGVAPTPEITASNQVPTEPDAATWKAWHKTLSDELFEHIKEMLVKIGPPETEREFYCKVHWRINPDGRVILLKIDGPQSHFFRDVVRAAVDSMKTSTNLRFPEGSTKPYAQKISQVRFWWNPSSNSYDLFEPSNKAE